MTGSLARKVAIVTGSSSGIGRATVLALAAEGASVVVHGRNEKRLKSCTTLLLEAGVESSRFLVVAGEIQSSETQKQLVEKTVHRFGRIDILVNNAATCIKPDCDPAAIDNLDYLFNVNLRSLIVLTNLVLPYLEESKGTVVNVSSVGSKKVVPGAIYYGILKSALNHYGRSMAEFCAPKGIRVNTVLPGLVKTNFMAPLGVDETTAGAIYDRTAQTCALERRAGEAHEIAAGIVFLASSGASYITGQELVIDGGDTVHRYSQTMVAANGKTVGKSGNTNPENGVCNITLENGNGNGVLENGNENCAINSNTGPAINHFK